MQTHTRPERPFIGTRQFRWYALFIVMAFATAGVIIFEILPKVRETERIRREQAQKASESILLPAGGKGSPLVQVDPKLAHALETVKDHTSIDQTDEGRLALLEHLLSTPPARLGESAFLVGYKDMEKLAPMLRGQPIKITALFLEWQPVALEKKVKDREFISRAFLMAPAGDEGFVVDLLTPPQGFEQRDLVDVEGYFLKFGDYTAGSASKEWTRSAPLLVGYALRRGERPGVMAEIHDPKTFSVLAIATVVGATLLWMLMIYFQRKGEMRRLALMESKLAEHRMRRPAPMRFRGEGTPAALGGTAAAAGHGASDPLPAAGKSAHLAPATAGAHPRFPVTRPEHPFTGETRRSRNAGPPRLLVMGVLTILMALLGLTGVQLYDHFFPGKPVISLESFAALDDEVSRGEAARLVVRAIEARAVDDPGSLRKEDFDVLRSQLGILEKATQTLQDHLEEARLAGWREQHPRPKGAGTRDYGECVLSMKCWILDVDGLIGLEKQQPEFAGIFLPLTQLERDAAKALAEANVPQMRALLDRAERLDQWIRDGLSRDEVPYHALSELQPLLHLRERLAAALPDAEPGKIAPNKAPPRN